MSTKLSFTSAGNAYIDENGEYEVSIDSTLGHRFSLVDGAVVDKYDGVSDEEVRRIDHEAAIALAVERGEEPPPPLA